MSPATMPRLFTAVLCFFTGFAYAQSVTFQKKIGTSSAEYLSDIIETSGGYLIAGTSSAGSASNQLAMLLYTDKNGDLLWQKSYGGTYAMEMGPVAEANDGGFIAWGYTRNAGTNGDAWLLKVDTAGKTQWQKTIGEPGYSEAPTGNIIVLPDGYILSGTKRKAGYSQSFVLRIDNDGNTVWSRFMPSGIFSSLHVAYLADSLLYLTGTVSNLGCWRTLDPATGAIVHSQEYLVDTTNWFYQMHRSPDGDHVMTGIIRYEISGLSKVKGWVQKVDSKGQLIWSKTYQAFQSNNLFASSMAADGSSILGSFYLPSFANYAYRAALIKIDNQGAVLWAKSYGNSQNIRLRKIIQTSDGGVLAAGYMDGPSGPGDSELFLVKTDSMGNTIGCCTANLAVEVEDAHPVLKQEPFDEMPFVHTLDFLAADADTSALQVYDICLNDQPVSSQTIQFCPGEQVTIAGTTYNQSGTVTQLLPSDTGDCDTIATYTLELLTAPALNETIQFCPGETVTIAGHTYDQPGIVTTLLPVASGGCDTIATYTLEFSNAGQQSALDLVCPDNIGVTVPAGTGSLPIDYALPLTGSDCFCPGMLLELASGMPSGSTFPAGLSTVCYRASDACGSVKTCCFQVNIQEETTCDSKTAGCLNFELLQVNRDAAQNWVYRIRVTNHCAAALQYVYLQLPKGMAALAPTAAGAFSAPGGNIYAVRNPNFSPFYGLRFSPVAASPHNGQSEVFRFVLPAQAQVDYIHAAARLTSGAYSEVYLNTFYCPVGAEAAAPLANRTSPERQLSEPVAPLRLSPNPAAAVSIVQVQGGFFPSAVLVLYDLLGRMVLETPIQDNQALLSDQGLAPGLYHFQVLENGSWAGSGKLIIGK